MSRLGPDRAHLLLRVSQLHYEQRLTQQEVGDRLHLTRWQVGRLLKEAHAKGIVRIEIVHPQGRDRQLENELMAVADLAEAVVIPGTDDPVQTRQAVARAAGEYLADLAEPPGTLAVSWGRTMSDVASTIPSSWAQGTRVVQANGGLSRPGPGDPAAIITALARQAGGSTVFLPAPAIVDSPELAAALRREQSIAEVLRLARSADVLLFSLGAVNHESVLVQSGCLQPADEEMLIARGAVGDAVGRFLDAAGNAISPELEARSIGLELSDVIDSRLAIAVACGQDKWPVAQACLRRGLCDVLVTDSGTARHLTAVLAEQPKPVENPT